MIVVNPDNATHIISVVPRLDIESVSKEVQAFVDRVSADSGSVESEDCTADVLKKDFLSVTITDNFKSISNSLDNTFDVLNGKLVITFDYSFRDEGRYDIAITYTNTLEVAYRGILVATNQNTQDYRLTNGKFYY